MRTIILITCAALGVAACAKNDSAAVNDLNAVTADNMSANDNMAMTGAGGADGNVATNAATEQNMMVNDLTHNDADTNLANGM